MGYSKGDAAKDTGVSIKEAAGTWHAAKDDAQRSGELNERLDAKVEKGYKDLARDAYKSDSSNSNSSDSGK